MSSYIIKPLAQCPALGGHWAVGVQLAQEKPCQAEPKLLWSKGLKGEEEQAAGLGSAVQQFLA